MNGPQITGLVALVEDDYTLVINRGADAGVTSGMTFAVRSDAGRLITDPASGRELGRLPATEKLRVKVFEVHQFFARAETYGTDAQRSPGTPAEDYLRAYDTPLLDPEAAPAFNAMSELVRHAADNLEEHLLPAEPSAGDVVTINVGDPVELVDTSPSRSA